MSRTRQLVKAFTKLFKQISKQFLSAINKQLIWLLRTTFGINRRRGSANAGFVLPTVAMVSIVVVLLTAAILFRSFERSKNASNVRVNEVVLRAAAPALDRARAKLEKLFLDPRLPRSTPSDVSLSQVINDYVSEFTLGDETQLKLFSESGDNAGVQEDQDTLRSAWKYPVDTDNNGKFDSYTLYGIYFRTPTSTRARSALESRAQPMDEGLTGGKCASNVATSADLVGSQGWYKVGSKLKRSIFVYTTTVPITDIVTPALDSNKYEKFTGNKGFSSLEYQQDRERFPLTNNAVIYENDLEIAPGGGIKINGRVFTNGNLLTRNSVKFFLVSSPYSCYFTQENSKVAVAGNVVNTKVNETADPDNSSVTVDLFEDYLSLPAATRPATFAPSNDSINTTNKTVPAAIRGNSAAFNDAAYARRIDRLVALATGLSDLPKEVTNGIASVQQADPTITAADAKKQQLELYFRKRTRRVPYAEVGVGDDALTEDVTNYPTPLISNEGAEALRPIDEWVFPFNPSDGKTETGYAEIGINTSGNKIQLAATDPAILKDLVVQKEQRIGDRVLVGNNLPQFWYDSATSKFVSSEKGQNIVGKEWDNNTTTRQRFSQASQLDDFGSTDRNGFWEKAATQQPSGKLDVVGGLRVVTGAGIYLPDSYAEDSTSTAKFNTAVAADPSKEIIWPDSMAMGVTNQAAGLPLAETPYLRMRATAVYHYQDSPYNPKTPATYQTPIACVSSYYDPTNNVTAGNRPGLIDVPLLGASGRALSLTATVPVGNLGKSHNGVVYSSPSLATAGYLEALKFQARLKYPNGRLVNPRLNDAVTKLNASGDLTLSEQSAVDTAMCALKIFDGTLSAADDAKIPHGAIMETTFLDARQVKAIDKVVGSTQYDLDVERRQPLEIRATILDLDLLRRKTKTDGEFLFPNSGIIYATRDDALPDASTCDPDVLSTCNPILNATDFKLDPTRRPNGIMLINGGDLSRNADNVYKAEEKGLILASNLPVYVKGNFNRHTRQEFKEDLTSTWNNFYTRGNSPASDLDPRFACRKNQFGDCGDGETWRAATVLADAITVLSDNFKLGYRNDGDYNLNDNYGNYPVGYDFNGGGIDPITPAPVTLDETAIKLDVNGDGDMTDTTVSTVDEPAIGVDLNNDGDKTDLAVPINESNITATVAARLNGFWENNFVTSRSFIDSQYSGDKTACTATTCVGSSYFNNFVTPIQRRATFAEYVMEICRKQTVTACKPSDWVVGYNTNKDNNLDSGEMGTQAKDLLGKTATQTALDPNPNKTLFGAGTTAQAALLSEDQGYPRRVAFLRDGNNNLRLFGGKPVLIGINTSNTVTYYPYGTQTIDGTSYNGSDTPRTQSNALWFRTWKTITNPLDNNYDPKYPLKIENTLTGSRPTEQPLLVPVLQIQYPTASPSDGSSLTDDGDFTKNKSSWFQIPQIPADGNQVNLVFAQGDTPGRPSATNFGESNGGLENFVRFLENWQGIDLTIRGSFIQFKRSSFATAPWQVFVDNYSDSDTKGYASAATAFGYPQGYRVTTTQASGASVGRTPFYVTPNRAWGYDVALLTQLPDLFSQRFTSPSVNDPNEFFREVGRDDPWVQTLLCGAQKIDAGAVSDIGYGTATSAKYGTDYKYAVSSDQRPTCP